ncbi:hypothetical protein GCM10009539_75200 [Cryptosporangium japonicum]|uniref:MFS transporter n=1 Tax=Cryptosporangium japonicum TaxID=80872 RepID=A0ABN0V5Q7_9ACTN
MGRERAFAPLRRDAVVLPGLRERPRACTLAGVSAWLLLYFGVEASVGVSLPVSIGAVAESDRYGARARIGSATVA